MKVRKVNIQRGRAVRITALERQKSGKGYRLYLDGELAMTASADLVQRRNLHEGDELSPGHLRILRDLQAKETAYRAALRLLGYRPRSEQELRRRLRLKGMTVRAVEPAIQRLRRAGLLDDAAFARFYVESRQSASPRGRSLLRHELRTKGVEPDVVLAATSTLDEEEISYQAALRRARRLDPSDVAGFRRRMMSFLASRGFSYGTIRQTLSRLEDELVCETPAQP
jgi:regulatory protein